MVLRIHPIFLLAAVSASSLFAEMRPWMSSDGQRTIQGDFVKREATSVTIRLASGKEAKIELTKLHPDETKWLNNNHPLAGESPAPDPAAVFDTLLFGDSREVVAKKLKDSKIVETTTDDVFFGRSGLNGMYFTRQKIGKVKASLYFDWTEEGNLKELTLQTEFLPDTAYKSDLEPTWAAMVELLSTLYGKPVQKGPLPAMESLTDGTFTPSHLWALDGGGGALLGTACEGRKYQLVVRFTQKKIQAVAVP